MERHVIWAPWHKPGLEHFRLTYYDDEIVGDGLVIAVIDEKALRAGHVIHCSRQWVVRQVEVEIFDESTPKIALYSDGQGSWTTATGIPIPELNGCLDVDISFTPFTNTLPIRRLHLTVGASQELAVVYIKVPTMEVKPVKQRYTCLQLYADGGIYRYENVETGFTADLTVDTDGLLIDYPGAFKRFYSNALEVDR
jgi:uncharacterized protein